MTWRFFFFISVCIITTVAYASKELNLYLWAGQISPSIIKQFREETGINVNLSSYDSNETLYAKLKSSKNIGYDIISPSTYFTEKMHSENMLVKIDKKKLSNYKFLDKAFLNKAYDPNNDFSIPLQWGSTGIFINKHYFPKEAIHSWSTLWKKRFYNKVLLLDDMREIFSMALLSLGFSANDSNPKHITQAYHHLLLLMPNIKLFNSSAVVSLATDEDVALGMGWNGAIFKASLDNPALTYVYPSEGFVLWIDSLAIPTGAPHIEQALTFINFMLRPDIAAKLIQTELYPVPNTGAKAYLPPSLKNHPFLFPNADTIKRGEVQRHIPKHALQLIEKYWELLKMSD